MERDGQTTERGKMARLSEPGAQKSPPGLDIDQRSGQSLPERLSLFIGPMFQDFSDSLDLAISPVLQELQQRIGQVVAEQVEQALPLIRIEPPQLPFQEAEKTGSYRGAQGTRQPRRNEVPGRTHANGGTDRPAVRSRQVDAQDREGVTQPQSTNLADLVERVLDKGIVIAGDITLSVVGIELLQLKIRLLIASVDKAQQIGIDWWKSDPALSSRPRALNKGRDRLEERLDRLEARLG